MEQQRVPLGEYNFPGPQYMHMVPPPPAPYMAPEQFYGHLMPFSTPQQSPDSPAPYGRKRASSDSSVDVPAVEEPLPLVFKGSRSAPSIKSMYTRSIDTFTWMLAFDSFTGNGGSDPDSDDPTAIQKKRLTAARKAGLNLGSLKPATITEWDDNGWYDLFNNRLGTSAKISREVVRNSASALSDAEVNLDDDGADSDANINPVLLAQSRTTTSHPAPPKPLPQLNSFGAIGDFMKMKMVSEEKRTHALDAKLQLEREKLELDKAKAKVDMARNVFQMEGASNQVKDAANAYLLSIFS
ncbi:hypothetical protein C8R43DRAFT_1140110 [Mycena crocata]|nr:hypothetical protein C8R43DRAFT_1140110 [Mycena crocata]